MDDFNDIYMKISSDVNVDFRIALGLPPEDTDEARREKKSQRVINALKSWLKHNYNFERYGLPTWRRLVQAVASPAGGNNRRLANEIASEHRLIGNPFSYNIISCPLLVTVDSWG